MKICLMGVGNVLMGDDALGPFVLKSRVAAWELPFSVSGVDAFAQAKAALLAEIKDVRGTFPEANATPDPIASRYRPRLDDLEASVTDCQTGVELEKFAKDFHDWKAVLDRDRQWLLEKLCRH